MSTLGEANPARPVGLDDAGPIRRRRAHPAARAIVSPAFIFLMAPVLLLVVLPVAITLTQAFSPGGFRSSGTEDGILGHAQVWRSLGLTLILVGLCFAITGAAVPLAHWSRQVWPRPGPVAAWLVGALLVVPAVVPMAVTAIAFRLLSHPDPERGLFSWLVSRLIGQEAWSGGWLVPLTLMLAFAWAWLGYATVLMRTAADQVPQELVDAARMAEAARSSDRGQRQAAGASHDRPTLRVLRDAYWQPRLRSVSLLTALPMLIMTSRMLELVLIGSPNPTADETKVLAVLHRDLAGGDMTPASAAVGIVWWAMMIAAVGLVVMLARPDPSPSITEPASAPQDRADRPAGLWVSALVLVGVWLVPLVLLALGSLRSPHEAAAGGWWSGAFSTESYAVLGRSGFGSSFLLTAVTASVVATAVTVVASLVARALPEMSAHGTRNVIVALGVLAVVPVQVVAGPLHMILDDTSAVIGPLPDSLRLVLAHVALTVPLGVVVLSSAGRDRSTAGARTVTGIGSANSRWQRVKRLPTALHGIWDEEPAVVTVFVLVFVLVWNDFVVGLFFAGRTSGPLAVFLFGETRHFVANSGPLAAGSVLTMLPPLALLVATFGKVRHGLIGVVPPKRARGVRAES